MKGPLAFVYLLHLMLMPLAALGDDVAPRPDKGMSAHVLKTGALIWANDAVEVGNTRLILHDDGLEVIDWPDHPEETRVGLNPQDGTTRGDLPSGAILERSSALWPPRATLERGWTLTGFDPGNSLTLEFHDASGNRVWTLDPGDYVHSVAAIGDLVFTARSYLSDEGVLRAWQAGEDKSTWSFDLNSSEGLPERHLRTMTLWAASESMLLVQSETHLFALEPSKGKLLWHVDVLSTLGAEQSDLYQDWGSPTTHIALSDGVAVISYDRKVLALDLTTQKLLWTLNPDTDPHRAVPLIYDGVVYITTGALRAPSAR